MLSVVGIDNIISCLVMRTNLNLCCKHSLLTYQMKSGRGTAYEKENMFQFLSWTIFHDSYEEKQATILTLSSDENCSNLNTVLAHCNNNKGCNCIDQVLINGNKRQLHMHFLTICILPSSKSLCIVQNLGHTHHKKYVQPTLKDIEQLSKNREDIKCLCKNIDLFI